MGKQSKSLGEKYKKKAGGGEKVVGRIDSGARSDINTGRVEARQVREKQVLF